MVIVLVILFGSYASSPGNQTFGWPQKYIVRIRLSVLIEVLHSLLACRYVYKHITYTQTQVCTNYSGTLTSTGFMH